MVTPRYGTGHLWTWIATSPSTGRPGIASPTSPAGAAAGRSRLEPAELDELVQLYQRVSGHLSHARVAYADPSLTALADPTSSPTPNAVIYGARSSARTAVRDFVLVTFPGAIWRIRHFVVVSALLTLVPAFAVGAWIANSDAALDASAPEAVRAAYVEEDFEAYYSSEPASQFAAEVTFNNIQVSITAFAIGILACVPTAGILAFNGANVGVAGGLFHAVGEWERFWGLILPHGLLEISAVIVAGAAGLRLGWTLIDPGDRPRDAGAHRRGAPGRRGRARAGRRVRRGRPDRGLRHRLAAAHRWSGSASGSLVEVAFITYVVRLGRVSAEQGRVADADRLRPPRTACRRRRRRRSRPRPGGCAGRR